jgi:hypothetical protein
MHFSHLPVHLYPLYHPHYKMENVSASLISGSCSNKLIEPKEGGMGISVYSVSQKHRSQLVFVTGI